MTQECHETLETLRVTLSGKNDPAVVVALCTHVQLPNAAQPLALERSGVTLVGCCGVEGNENKDDNHGNKCTITRSGQGRNLIVTGSNFSMHNTILQNGFVDDSVNTQRQEACGANLLFNNKNDDNCHNNVPSSCVQTSDCEFLQGQCWSGIAANEGGNVHIETATGGSACVDLSKFASGKARFGGGVAVVGASKVILEACEVEENQGSGMAHFVWDFSNPAIKNPGQDILIHDSAFANNQGEFGGAIF